MSHHTSEDGSLGKGRNRRGIAHVLGDPTLDGWLMRLDPYCQFEVIGGSCAVHGQGKRDEFDLSRMRTAVMSN